MSSQQLMQFFISGITMGAIYALVALGFTIIFNSSSIINFAQGEFVMFGGVIAASLHNSLGWPLLLAIVLAILLTAAIGGVAVTTTIQRLKKPNLFTLIMITVALSIIFQSVALLIWGPYPLYMQPFSGNQPILLLGATILPQTIWVLGVVAVVVSALMFFYRYTRLGQAMLAASINKEAAAAMGINIRLIVLVAFMLAGAFGGLGGVLITPLVSTSYQVGFMMTLKGFAAAVLGGMGNSLGAVAGGFTLGIIEAMGTGVISSGHRDAIALGVLIVFLMLRPSGLLGSKAVA